MGVGLSHFVFMAAVGQRHATVLLQIINVMIFPDAFTVMQYAAPNVRTEGGHAYKMRCCIQRMNLSHLVMIYARSRLTVLLDI